MITIESPYLETHDDYIYVNSHIIDEALGIDTIVWYRTDKQYGQYLVEETADAFVLPMIIRAVENHEDMVVNAPMSEKLYYNITHNLLYTLAVPLKVNSDVSVSCSRLVKTNFGGKAVGCGCSLGVDSFSAMIRHMSDDCPEGFRITHLTNFNVGAYGNNFDQAHDFMEDSLSDVRDYAAMKQMPLVILESNFGVFFQGVNFNWCGAIRTMSAALSMQKLFGRYYYASSGANDSFDIHVASMGHFASLVVPMYSTESTEFVVVDQDKTRIQKTEALASDPLAQKFLDVCWKKIRANRGETQYMQYPYKNCTRCSKCIRTILTLDILGYAENFKEVFDLDYFYQNKDKIVYDFVAHKDENHHYKDVYDLMVEKGYPIPKVSLVQKSLKVLRKIKHKVLK